MELEYVPKACKVTGAKVTGKLKIKLPSVIQKYEYMDKCGIEVDGNGEVNTLKMNSLKFIKTLIEISKDHYVDIDLKKVDGAKITSWDEMIYDPDCEPVINEVATALVSGFKISGN
jgi:hypothetical protein